MKSIVRWSHVVVLSGLFTLIAGCGGSTSPTSGDSEGNFTGTRTSSQKLSLSVSTLGCYISIKDETSSEVFCSKIRQSSCSQKEKDRYLTMYGCN